MTGYSGAQDSLGSSDIGTSGLGVIGASGMEDAFSVWRHQDTWDCIRDALLCLWDTKHGGLGEGK